MNKTEYILTVAIALITATLIGAAGTVSAMPLVLAGRTLPGTYAGALALGGLPDAQLAQALALYEQDLLTREATLTFREHTVNHTLADLGVSLDKDATAADVSSRRVADLLTNNLDVSPRLAFDMDKLKQLLAHDFAHIIQFPQDATLALTPAGGLTAVPGRAGEQVNLTELTAKIQQAAAQDNINAFELSVVMSAPRVEDHEVETARVFAETLLREGMQLVYGEETFDIQPYALRRLIAFRAHIDPASQDNYVLGVVIDAKELAAYLETTVAPAVNQSAQDARFTLSPGEGPNDTAARVEQFALPREGRQLDLDRSAGLIAASLAGGRRAAPLAVEVTQPNITSTADIERLGITTLLAAGESDFVGSPKNRVHNINIGASRYHGALIAPGEEFSFNGLLGPVTAAAGFLPELVIKNNVTTPEFGGGLCQVSTTIFRAALNAGLEVTQRRNHSYAVSYYGTPGLDATIYPPYTDLRFRNNTPGHILVQSEIVGTKLRFEFWGTDDGREVTVAGPVTYDRQPDGAVKAYVEQSVTKDGQVIIEDTFYSRYRSPKLFPRASSENGET